MKFKLSMLYNIKGSLSKYKRLIIEFLINVISFSLLIVVQQVIALPLIARIYDIDMFGKVIIAFGISNIITSLVGFSIGNARLLDNKFYNQTYLRLLFYSNIFILPISFLIYLWIFSDDFTGGIIYAITCVLGSIRFFFISEYRIKDEHNQIFKQNLYYFLGILIGIAIFYFFKNWLIIFFIAELLSVTLSYVFNHHKNRFFKLFVDKSNLKLTNVVQLMFNNGISYTLSQYARFIIYPILGPSSVSLYYSTSISARVGGLIMNPLSNYILGKIANKRERVSSATINIIVLSSLVISVMYFILVILATPILLKILYPGYLERAEYLIMPICIAAAIMGGTSILKPVIMKFMGVKYFNKIFIVYGIILVVLSLIFSFEFGLIGVAIANLIASLYLFIYQVISLKITARKMDN